MGQQKGYGDGCKWGMGFGLSWSTKKIAPHVLAHKQQSISRGSYVGCCMRC